MYFLVAETNPKLQYKISSGYLLVFEIGPTVNYQWHLSLQFLYRPHLSSISHF